MLGHDRIRERTRELSGYLRQRLSSWRGLSVATPAEAAMCGAIAAFRLPENVNTAVLRSRLWEQFRVEASVIDRDGQQAIRVSTHFFNTHAEIDLLVDALGELL
jgi:selenocysteine lyase/cysteine desulfurase